ncbi:unnamed protein product [Diabrotica balteata]|uniref:Uncharacterized protein n=1 Tax=Diabrotica balteata TaxID=107213 RepID=A0A9N9XHM8_DIABA|nr:unnamed protein product [Diabrotica balteata]
MQQVQPLPKTPISDAFYEDQASYGDDFYEEGPFEERHHGIKHYFKNFLLPRHEKSYLHSIHLECQRESSCELEYLQNPFQYMDYEPLGNYMLCISKRYGFMGSHGHLNFENLKYKLGMICGSEDPEIYINIYMCGSLLQSCSYSYKPLELFGSSRFPLP